MPKTWRCFYRAVAVMLLVQSAAIGARVESDGSYGVFHPTVAQTIALESVAPNGVFNCTTIHIPANVTLTFSLNAINTPVFLAATGDVLIEGTINVSGKGFSRSPGPGGWSGGAASTNLAGSDGTGPSPGMGGPSPSGQGNAGGGAGMATDGAKATSRTGSNPAAGGRTVPRPRLIAGMAGGGGSGGGGGGGRTLFGVNISGGDGGGGGGGLQISSPGRVTITGRLLSNGAHGGWAFANVFAHGGPGGGGAGGNIEIYGQLITIAGTGVIDERGGAGGGLSTEPVPNAPYVYSSGAEGGQGYLLLCGDQIEIDSAATIIATVVGEAEYIPADFNMDGHVDLVDFEHFAACATGSTILQSDNDCLDADLHSDGDVDMDDFGLFQRCFSGPDEPANPCCIP